MIFIADVNVTRFSCEFTIFNANFNIIIDKCFSMDNPNDVFWIHLMCNTKHSFQFILPYKLNIWCIGERLVGIIFSLWFLCTWKSFLYHSLLYHVTLRGFKAVSASSSSFCVFFFKVSHVDSIMTERQWWKCLISCYNRIWWIFKFSTHLKCNKLKCFIWCARPAHHIKTKYIFNQNYSQPILRYLFLHISCTYCIILYIYIFHFRFLCSEAILFWLPILFTVVGLFIEVTFMHFVLLNHTWGSSCMRKMMTHVSYNLEKK